MTHVGKFGDPCVERHTALIYDRGGVTRILQVVDLTKIEWGRTMDGKSTAQVTVSGRACREQTKALLQIQARRHELVLYRGADRVWEGPIVYTKSTSSSFTIFANDVIEYLDNTALTRKWGNAEDPVDPGPPIMTERIEEIVTYELTTPYDVVAFGSPTPVEIPRWETVNPPANVLPYLDVRAGTTLTRAVTEAFEMSVGEHLSNLGRSVGVSYTTVGRSIVVWDGTLGELRTLTEADFSGDFSVIADGSEFFTIAHVVATTTEGTTVPAVGHAANDLAYYGPWEGIVSLASESASSDAPNQDELNSQARRAIVNQYPLPLVFETASNASLIPSTGLTINQLVAGVDVPVRTAHNLHPVSQLQRLKSMTVTETAEGENISVTLIAVGDVE